MVCTKNTLMAVACLSLILSPVGASAQTVNTDKKLERLTSDFVNATRAAMPAVVSIEVKKEIQEIDPAESLIIPSEIPWLLPEVTFPKRVKSMLGSGAIVSKSGYILTHADLVSGGVCYTVTLHNGKSKAAKLVSIDAQSKLALLKISGSQYTPLNLAKKTQCQKKSVLLTFQKEKGEVATVKPFYVQKTAKIFCLGQSMDSVALGGPMVNLKGELVGVVNTCCGKATAIDARTIQRFLFAHMTSAQLIPESIWDVFEKLK